ncbi:hypothetical protein TUBRATIS_003190 [Tubulinosema ratisbonensis]|uniref:Uncharacterized protein n=1 Tax=Tubulinosema ratisbonensis TaxID=291195 RepID=A0A437AQ62_9MICR|nr:hypothetical protein TUBRATIS_003190 [Tubulinosema ratisbonensis]
MLIKFFYNLFVKKDKKKKFERIPNQKYLYVNNLNIGTNIKEIDTSTYKVKDLIDLFEKFSQKETNIYFDELFKKNLVKIVLD